MLMVAEIGRFPSRFMRCSPPSRRIDVSALAGLICLGVLLTALNQSAVAAVPTSDVAVMNNDVQGISLRYRPQTLAWSELITPEKTYRTPQVMGSGASWPAGMPQLPARVIWLAIPPGATPILSAVLPYSVSSMPDVPAPVPTAVPDPGGLVSYVYEEDAAFYAASSPFPSVWVEMEGPETYRNLRVVRVVIYPYRFPSSSSGTLTLDSVDVQIQFQGGSPGAFSYTRPIEDEFFQGFIANWQGPAKSWKLPRIPQTSMEDPWPSGDLYKIEIDQSGTYRLTYNDLVNAGINVNGLDPSTIRIFNNGGEVLPKNLQTERAQAPIENAIMIKDQGAPGSFDQGDEIWFYGKSVHEWKWNSLPTKQRYEHYRNPYTDRDVYWLNINPAGPPGKRMESLGLSGTANLTPLTTRSYLYEEKELYAVYSEWNLPQSMPELYGDSFTGASSRTINFNLEEVVASAPALIVIKFRSGDKYSHSFSVYVNNTWIFNTSSGYASGEATIDAGILHDGNNTIYIEHLSTGVAYLDYYEIESTRYLSTSTNQLQFISPDANGLASYQVNGLSSPWIFDITDFANVKSVQASSFKDSSNSYVPKRYLAVNPSAFLSPLPIVKDQRSADEYENLRTTLSADLLVVVNDAFYDAMKDYEDYRENEAASPMQVLRVKTSDIFDEYGWGLPDAAAIRDFFKTTLPIYNWTVSPLYVLFVGDGDFDYKNKLAPGDANWVIPYEEGSQCTDDWYSYFTPGDDNYTYPQLVTGRWPARSVGEVEELISRVKAYESEPEYGPWKDRVTFVADDEYGGTSNNEQQHTTDTEFIAENYIPNYLNIDKIYLTEYPVTYDPGGGGRRKPGATADLISDINDGCLLVNYMGHGNPTVWAHEAVFLESRDLPLLNNGNRLPLFIAATCDWAYWDDPYTQSMPEVMLTLPGGGAIGAIAATRVTGSGSNNVLISNFYQELFSVPTGIRIGLALMRAKASVYDHYIGYKPSNSNAELYHLLGDPVLKLATPDLSVQIDSNSVDTLTALDQVTVTGEIHTQSGIFLSSFQGISRLQVFDIRIPVYYGFNNSPPPLNPTYILPGNLIFRGDATVENGRFESTFVVPVDISYGGSGGRFSVYSYSDETDAVGVDDSVIFAESAAVLQDSIPPSVNIYFDSPAFRSGDPVSPTSTLFVEVSDSNGVNITGNVGHGITVTIDGQTVIDLTDAFSYYLDSHTSGAAGHDFLPGEISSGSHTAEAVAWDAANNPSTAEISFEVLSTGTLKLEKLLNYPNPFKGSTHFTFVLSGGGADRAEVSIKIYTVAGRLVKVISGIKGEDNFNYNDPSLVWDGRDEQGDLLSNGVYLYKVKAKGTDGSTAEEIGKLMVIR